MNTHTLNLIDDHRRLQLQHRKDDPEVICALLHVQGCKVAFATADLARCRFSRDSDGEVLFWVGSTNFTICGSEFEHIEEFLAQCREYWEEEIDETVERIIGDAKKEAGND